MKKIMLLFIAALLIFPLVGAEAKKKKKKKSSYKVVEVTNGGSISGKAVFGGGTAPKDETVTLTSEQDLCGNTLPARKYVINGSNEIKNVVVFLDGIKKGKAVPNAPVVIDNNLCAFEPHVSVGFSGKKNTIGLPDKGSTVEKKMRKPGVMSVKCDSHPWMLGYVYLFPHPYAAVTNEKGEFSIGDIPAGSYKVKAWHEGFGEIELGKVTVDAGKTAMVKAEFK
jgi:hypothetical protein